MTTTPKAVGWRRCRRCHRDHAKYPYSAEVLDCKASSAAHMRAQRAKKNEGRAPSSAAAEPIDGVVLSAPAKWKPTRTHGAVYSIGMPKDGLAAWMLDPGLLPKRPPGARGAR